MTPPQIVHLTTVHPRNDTRIFLKQVHTLFAEFGPTVCLVVADGLGDSNAINGPTVHDLGKLPASRLKRSLIGNWRALVFLLKLRPTLVHFHDPELIPLCLLLRVLGLKIVYDVHEDVPRQTMSKHWIPVILRWPIAKAIQAMEAIAAWAFSGIVPATPHIASRFPPGKTALVQNFPIQSELQTPNPSPHADRPPIFAYVGLIAEIRGAKEMVQALSHLKDRPDATLAMAGGIDPKALLNELRGLPGWPMIDFTGSISREEVARLLGRSRAGLVLFHPMPNHVDAQPNKMFEYMSAGLPVIASDFPLWREIVDGRQCGLLVDPLDTTAIAQALRWILENPQQAQVMGQNGARAIKEQFNWEAESRKLVGLYNRLGIIGN